MTEPTLDIMIPFWGNVQYLKDTVSSVLGQDSPDWRLTVIDDAYPDEGVAAYFADLQDPRIRYLRKPANEGITANFRSCVAFAQAPYMMMLGCDDLLLPGYVSSVLKAIRDFPDAQLIQPGIQIIDESGKVYLPLGDRIKGLLRKAYGREPLQTGGEKLAVSLLHGDWLYWPSLVFRTGTIKGTDFRDDFPIILDLAVILDLVFDGTAIAVVPDAVFQYRRHSQSASSVDLSDTSRFDDERRYFALAAGLAAGHGWRKAALAARLRLTSRLHALTLLPKAVATVNPGAAARLIRHGLGS